MKALKAFKLIFSFCPELGRERLTLPAPCISENCIKVKINLIFFLFSHVFMMPQKVLWSFRVGLERVKTYSMFIFARMVHPSNS